MRFLLLSDIHATSKSPVARKDNVMQTFFKKLSFVLDYAQKNGCVILQAGDFFDKPRDWYLLFKIMKVLKKSKVPIYSVFGQHDSYLYSNINRTPTTLSILNRINLVKMLWNKPITFDSGKVKVYGCSWKKRVPIPDPKCKTNILVIHESVALHPLFRGHKFKHVKRFAKRNSGYKLILVGDIHRKFEYKYKDQIVINTGPMLRLDAIEYNSYHKPCMFVYDSETSKVDKVDIPHKGYKKVLDYSHLSRALYTQQARTAWIQSIKNAKLITTNIKERILIAIEKKPISHRAKKILERVIEDENSN